MESIPSPTLKIAKKVLPAPLLECICDVFSKKPPDCMLVGETAFAGFYAGHRRSDDIDLFVKSEPSFQAALLAVKGLASKKVSFSEEVRSAQYYHSLCQYKNHRFTVDIVLDRNVFDVGSGINLENQVVVADLKTLFKMKAATLVSRCSEKDLYDIHWLLKAFPNTSLTDLVELGREIDAGMNHQSLLASVGGAILREDACEFSIDPTITNKMIFAEIKQLQMDLVSQTMQAIKNQPTPPLGALVRKAKKVQT